jgi:hypothetical protein
VVWESPSFGPWQQGVGPTRGDVSFISEHRLGFGVTISSNVGQRFADLIVTIFKRRFDIEELARFELILSSSGVCVGGGIADQATRRGQGFTDQCRWIARRRTLSRLTGRQELRAYAAHMYTDDIRVSVVGVERTVRSLRCWRGVTADLNLGMAIAAKRQVGTSLTWLGFEFFTSHGVVAVQQTKLLRAKEDIRHILAGGEVVFESFRSLLGLLEHMLVFVGGDRTLMDHLYVGNFRLGAEFGPTTRMVITDLHKHSFRRWQVVLLKSAGCFFSVALDSSAVAVMEGTRDMITSMGSTLFQPEALGDHVYHLYSDAASETDSGGLGGWVHGEWWHYAASKAERDLLHITALEFMAVGVNIILYGDSLAGHQVTICADALATVQVLNKGSARAPVMQAIYALITDLPEFQALQPWLSSAHVFGEVNVMSDAASRGKFQVLRDLSASIGVANTQVALPARALEFISDAKAAAVLVRQGQDQVAAAREFELVQQVQASLHTRGSGGPSAVAMATAGMLGALAGGGRAGVVVGTAAALLAPVDAGQKRSLGWAFDPPSPWAGVPAQSLHGAPPNPWADSAPGAATGAPDPPSPWANTEAQPPSGTTQSAWAERASSTATRAPDPPSPWADLPSPGASAPAHLPLGAAQSPWADSAPSSATWAPDSPSPWAPDPPSPWVTKPAQLPYGTAQTAWADSASSTATWAPDPPSPWAPDPPSPWVTVPAPSPWANSALAYHTGTQWGPRGSSPTGAVLAAPPNPWVANPSATAVAEQAGLTPPRRGAGGAELPGAASPGNGLQDVHTAWSRYSPGVQGGGWMSSPPSFLPPFPVNVRTILDALLSPLSVSPSPLLSAILQDNSEQALRPADRESLFGLIQAVSHAVESAIKPGTLKKDQLAWRHWVAFTAEMGTAAVRNDDPSHAPRETFLVAAFLVWLTRRLKSTIRGRTFCKASSYMALCYGVKRCHVRHGKRFDCLAMAKSVVKALNTEYCRREGPECLIPARREPFSRGMIRELLRAPNGLIFTTAPAHGSSGRRGSATTSKPRFASPGRARFEKRKSAWRPASNLTQCTRHERGCSSSSTESWCAAQQPTSCVH